MVMKASPAGEFDRRITLLTKERGKITAFARGARRMQSTLSAATVPFAMGTFQLYEGRSAYTCVAADIREYFEKLKADYIGACYGAYFMEFADYYAQENMEAGDMLNLLYVSLLALEKDVIPDERIRYAYEVRLMVQGGEFPSDITGDETLQLSTRQAFYHMITAPLGKLFSFAVTKPVMQEIQARQDRIRTRLVDRTFRSLDVLDSMIRGLGAE
ncbi:MAG TPA: DNA repair protein RecO [Lachnospiraceae bacterium]|nr:DNA repair protein RecO [Lachnospiraceae bacterium]